MTMASKPRDWPLLDPAIFVGALLLYAFAMPLGLARVEGAPHVAAGITLDSSTQPAFLALLAVRVGQYLPFGDAPLRANLVSAVLCALAIALLSRLCLQACALLRPPTHARQEPRDFVHEPIAATGAALAAAFSLSTFDVGATSGSASATLVLLVAALLPGFALLRDHDHSAAGYLLAGLAGLSVGVDPSRGRCSGRLSSAWRSGRCAKVRAGRSWLRCVSWPPRAPWRLLAWRPLRFRFRCRS